MDDYEFPFIAACFIGTFLLMMTIILGVEFNEVKDSVKDLNAQISEKDAEIERLTMISDEYEELFINCLESHNCCE